MSIKKLKKIIYILPFLLLLGTYLFFGCDNTSIPGGTGGCDNPVTPADPIDPGDSGGNSRRAITADWLNKTLSIIDLDALRSGVSYSDMVVGTIDLSQYSPGPIDVAVTKDGKLALVSISAGWFSTPGASAIIGENIPRSKSKILFVDLEQMAVVDELYTGDEPMSIVFNADGSKAFVAHFGGNYVVAVDVKNHKVAERIRVGVYSEELAHDDTNSVGIVSYSASGNIRTYDVSNPSGSLSRGLNLSGDAAGVAFFPNTKIAYVVQSPTPLTGMRGGYTVVDVNNPSSPRVLADKRFANMPSCYPAIAASDRNTVLVPVNQNDRLSLREISLNGSDISLKAEIDVCNAETLGALGMTYDAVAQRAIMAIPRDRLLAVTDLNTQESFTISWPAGKAGPADIDIIP